MLLLGIIGYTINKHIVTITDYTSNATPKTIFVYDLSTVKKIPNYEKDEGYELVLESDYEKYHQGYCLKENRILSDEEIFRRGIKQYLEKKIELDKKLSLYYIHPSKREPIRYYQLSGINITNWYEKFTKNYDKTKKSGLKEMLFKTFKAKPIDNVMKYVTIDMKSMSASFKKPIARTDYWGDYSMFLGKSFLLFQRGDEYGVNYGYIYLISGRSIDKSDKTYHDKMQNKTGSRDVSGRFPRKIDHCGNIDYSIKEKFSTANEAG